MNRWPHEPGSAVAELSSRVRAQAGRQIDAKWTNSTQNVHNVHAQ